MVVEKNKKDEMDPRNKLNNLSNKEWMILSRSVWESRPGARDPLKAKHPATFAESDIKNLIRFFTKKGALVLDPFLGSGSTLVACRSTFRNGIGIELIDKWVDIAKKRINNDQQTLSENRLKHGKRPSREEIIRRAKEAGLPLRF